MSKEYFLKKGARISIAKYEEYEYEGVIKQITPYHISIQSLSPIGSVISSVVPKMFRKKVRLAFKTEGEYHATECGINTARQLLMKIGHEERILLSDPFRLKGMLELYHKMVLGLECELFYETDGLLAIIQEKYFPDIEEIIFTDALMCKLQKYVHKNS